MVLDSGKFRFDSSKRYEQDTLVDLGLDVEVMVEAGESLDEAVKRLMSRVQLDVSDMNVI